MAVKTLYFDESGFTGYNLLDPVQPIFAVASTGISDAEAAQILDQSFPKYQGSEFKFTNIWGTNSRSGLLTFAGHLQTLGEQAFVYMIDKRFAVLTKIVDFLIEPYITDAGFDFYDEGFCWKYCNYIHYGLTEFAPPELYESLVNAYQAFSRNPTEESLAILHSRLEIMAGSTEEPVRIFLEQMELGARLFHKYHVLEKFKGSDELQLTSMMAIVSHWRGKYKEDFAVVHDASSNFLRGKEFWERITNNNVPKQLHRSGDGTMTEFPLRVVSTTPMDSKDSAAIQFCDVLAGLTTRHFSPRTEGKDRDFMNEVVEAGLKELSFNGIRPSTIFPDRIPPKRLTGPDIVDQMTNIMFGKHNDPKSSN
jgi:hypothetical protein